MKKQLSPFRLDDNAFRNTCTDFLDKRPQVRTSKNREEYAIILRAFRRWLLERDIVAIDEKVIEAWMLDAVQSASATTAGTKSIVLSHFIDYLVSRSLMPGNPFLTLKAQHRARGYRGIARILKETGSISELDALADTPFSGELEHHFLDLLEYEKALGKSHQSQSWCLESFERYLRLRNIADLNQIDSSLVAEWNNWHGQTSDYQKRARLVRLKQFFDFLLDQERIKTSPIPQLPPHRRRSLRPYIFSREEVKSILDAAENLPDHHLMPRRGPTYRMVFLMLYALGLRASEALKLRLEDIDFVQDTLTIHHTKFHKGRVLPFGPRFKAALQRHIKDHPLLRKVPATTFLFPTHSHRTPRLMRDSCYRTLRHILEELDIKAPAETLAPSPHSFRHSFAVHRVEKWMRDGYDVGIKLPLLSAFLGHIDVAATQIYLTMTPERLMLLGNLFEKAFGKPARNKDEEERS